MLTSCSVRHIAAANHMALLFKFIATAEENGRWLQPEDVVPDLGNSGLTK